MKTIIKISLIGALVIMTKLSVFAKQPDNIVPNKTSPRAASCSPASSSADLDINNVRAKILGGGDFWWDLNNPRYEVPKIQAGTGVSRHSIFAGSLWFAGITPGGSLRTAGQTYRQSGNDFWPGPLDTTDASILDDECKAWDRHFKINKTEIDEFLLGGEASAAIKSWPGNYSQYGLSNNRPNNMAPYKDLNLDGRYNPSDNDYPLIFGDQAIWWVFNDKGAPHTAYSPNIGGGSIGLEIQAMAFAFQTSDSRNDMTFYTYKIINRNTVDQLDSTYMAVWVDPDLGNAADDYVGCHAGLGLGYVYNGDDDDETNTGYCNTPPALGIDFFEGPIGDDGNRIPMVKFMYFTNGAPAPQRDPGNAAQLWNIIRGIWNDGNRLTYGGTGYSTTSTDYCDFAFPALTDPKHNVEWTEKIAGNPVGDRRWVQSAGPFTLKPGAVNTITTGVVWARASQAGSGSALASLNLLFNADRKAQTLFDFEFKIADGPVIDPVSTVELDQKVVIYLNNPEKTESYNITELHEGNDTARFQFEGYMLYQLANNTVTQSDLYDPTKAILVAQYDKPNGITKIINKFYNEDKEELEAQIMVEGKDNGIKHSFIVSTDAFNGYSPLINHKTYYFIVVPYAYGITAKKDTGDKKDQYSAQFLPSRKTKVFSVIPRISNPRFGGSELRAEVGSGPKIIRMSGRGNGGNLVDFDYEAFAKAESGIISNYVWENPVYNKAQGPLKITILDPFKIQDKEFELRFKNSSFTAGGDERWEMKNVSDPSDSYQSYTGFVNYEQVFKDLGFSINIDNNVFIPGSNGLNNNGLLLDTIIYSKGNPWIDGIRNGIDGKWSPQKTDSFNSGGIYTTEVLNGIVMPLRYVLPAGLIAPIVESNGAITKQASLEYLNGINVVLTSDESKWSECIVVETGFKNSLNEGGANKFFNLRKNANNVFGLPQGKSKFPGYAIDVETGERLNIFFGEASGDSTGNNSTDMLYNPTSDKSNFGGTHFLYITREKYDACDKIYSIYQSGNLSNLRSYFSENVTWVGFLTQKSTGKWLDNGNTATIKLRVATKYTPFTTGITTNDNDGYNYYRFSFEGQSPLTGPSVAEKALDLIRIVPNPYNAVSAYEQSKIDTRIKITNLPQTAIITIYTMNGNLVRQLTKDDPNTSSVDWDIINGNKVPVASGIYLVHVKVPGVGERTIKWFAVTRPVDLDNF
jgi:hypothetical protein